MEKEEAEAFDTAEEDERREEKRPEGFAKIKHATRVSFEKEDDAGVLPTMHKSEQPEKSTDGELMDHESLNKDMEAAGVTDPAGMQAFKHEEDKKAAPLQLDADDLTKERDMLKRERDAMMEERNALRTQASECSTKCAELESENNALKLELENLQEQGNTCQMMEHELNAIITERNALQMRFEDQQADLQEQDYNLRAMQDILDERDMLRMKLREALDLEGEMCQEVEVLRTERDRLKMRVDELESMETAYHDLLNNTRNMEVITAERDMFKAKLEEITALESEIEVMRDYMERLKGIDSERECLRRKVKELECTMVRLQTENNRLMIELNQHAKSTHENEVPLAFILYLWRLVHHVVGLHTVIKSCTYKLLTFHKNLFG